MPWHAQLLFGIALASAAGCLYAAAAGPGTRNRADPVHVQGQAQPRRRHQHTDGDQQHLTEEYYPCFVDNFDLATNATFPLRLLVDLSVPRCGAVPTHRLQCVGRQGGY